MDGDALVLPEAAETALALGNARHAIAVTVAAELRRLAEGEDGQRMKAIEDARISESQAGGASVAAVRAWARVGWFADSRDRLTARADELDGGGTP